LKSSFSSNGTVIKLHVIDKDSKPAAKSTKPKLDGRLLSELKTKKKKKEMDFVKQLTDLSQMPPIVVGMDLGQTFTVGACAKECGNRHAQEEIGTPPAEDDIGNPRPEETGSPPAEEEISAPSYILRNLSIKKKALNEPTHLFMKWLEKNKPDAIRALEATSSHRYIGESLGEYFVRWLERYEGLRVFYNSKLYCSKLWDIHKAQLGEYDKAVDSLLRMVGGRIHFKYDTRLGPPPMFVLGSSDFSSQNSVHSSFEKHFVGKVFLYC